MTYVALDEIAQEVSDEVAQLFGAPSVGKAPGPPPIKPVTDNLYLTSMVNIMRSGMGIAFVNPNAPVDTAFWQSEVSFNVEILGNSTRQIGLVLQDGFAAVNNHINAVGVQITGATGALQGNTLAAAEGYAAGLFNKTEADLSTWVNFLFHDYVTRDGVVLADAQNFYNAVETDLRTWVNFLFNDYVNRDADIAAQSRALFNQAESDIGTWVNFLFNDYVNRDAAVTAHADTLHAQDQTDIANVAQMAVGLSAKATTDAEAYTDTALQTQVQPQLDKLNTDVETCLDPLCDTVTPNANQLGKLGGLLKGLETLGIDALLAALLAEAVADPEAAAAQVVDAAGWTDSLGVELVNAVMG